MALYSRPETSFWYYEFKVERKRFRGSTKTADRAQAEAYEALERFKAFQAAKDSRDAAAGAVDRTTLWDAAQSWLVTTNLGDQKGNLSRVRKLFGTEMRLDDGLWREVPSNRFSLPRTITVAEMSPAVLEDLRESRRREGYSKGTIAQELSLLRVLLVHAQTMVKEPETPGAASNTRRSAGAQREFLETQQATQHGPHLPVFTYDERRKLSALAVRLTAHLRIRVAASFTQNEGDGESCALKVQQGTREGTTLAEIPLRDWGPDGFSSEVRKAQVVAIRAWKTVN